MTRKRSTGMVSGAILAAILSLAPRTAGDAGGKAVRRDPCKEPHVEYEPFDGKTNTNELVHDVTLRALDPVASAKVESTEGEKELSPMKTRWLRQVRPDYMKDGPWTSRILVRRDPGDVLEITVPDHDHFDPGLKWINEKLLFISVSWGRIFSTEMILDVEKNAFLYKEGAGTGEWMWDCPGGK